jgi:hypothetical protein
MFPSYLMSLFQYATSNPNGRSQMLRSEEREENLDKTNAFLRM